MFPEGTQLEILLRGAEHSDDANLGKGSLDLGLLHPNAG